MIEYGPWKSSMLNLGDKQLSDMMHNTGRRIRSSMAEECVTPSVKTLFTFSQKVKYMQ